MFISLGNVVINTDHVITVKANDDAKSAVIKYSDGTTQTVQSEYETGESMKDFVELLTDIFNGRT